MMRCAKCNAVLLYGRCLPCARAAEADTGRVAQPAAAELAAARRRLEDEQHPMRNMPADRAGRAAWGLADDD